MTTKPKRRGAAPDSGWLEPRFVGEDVRRLLREAKAPAPVSAAAALAAARSLNRLAATLLIAEPPSFTALRDRAQQIERAARTLLAALSDAGLAALEPAVMRGLHDADAAEQARSMAREIMQAANRSALDWNASAAKGGRPPNNVARALAFWGARAYHAATLRVPSAKEDGPAARFIGAVGIALGCDAQAVTVARVIAEMRDAGTWRAWGAKPGA